MNKRRVNLLTKSNTKQVNTTGLCFRKSNLSDYLSFTIFAKLLRIDHEVFRVELPPVLTIIP